MEPSGAWTTDAREKCGDYRRCSGLGRHHSRAETARATAQVAPGALNGGCLSARGCSCRRLRHARPRPNSSVPSRSSRAGWDGSQAETHSPRPSCGWTRRRFGEQWLKTARVSGSILLTCPLPPGSSGALRPRQHEGEGHRQTRPRKPHQSHARSATGRGAQASGTQRCNTSGHRRQSSRNGATWRCPPRAGKGEHAMSSRRHVAHPATPANAPVSGASPGRHGPPNPTGTRSILGRTRRASVALGRGNERCAWQRPFLRNSLAHTRYAVDAPRVPDARVGQLRLTAPVVADDTKQACVAFGPGRRA